jgi:hypothetical protein
VNNESKFFGEILKTMNPDWHLKLHNSEGAGPNSYSDLTVRTYIVDTSNGWILSSAMSEANLELLRETIPTQSGPGKEAVDGFSGLAAYCSKQNITAESEDATLASTVAMLTMTTTATYKRVKAATGSYAGHWFQIMYRLKDSTIITRPVFFDNHKSGLMSLDEIKTVVRDIVRKDHSHQTSVGALIHKSGGCHLGRHYV